jgi:hypothetical protein
VLSNFYAIGKKCSEHLKELDRNVGEKEVDQTDANPGTDYKYIRYSDVAK